MSLAWFAVGFAVIGTILFLGIHLNRKKATAALAVRLGEAYRSAGQFEVAMELYRVPRQLAQNIEEVGEAMARAERGERAPVLDRGLVEGARRQVEKDREGLERFFAARGVVVRLPGMGEGEE